MREIAFVGCNSSDLIIYLASMVIAGGHRAAIIDHTKTGICLYALSVEDLSGYSGELYITSSQDEKGMKKLNECEYELHYFGFEYPKSMAGFQEVFFVSNMEPFLASQLEGVSTVEDNIPISLIRDVIPTSYKESFLRGCMGRKFEEADCYSILYDEKDYVKLCALPWNHSHLVSKLSPGMRAVLTSWYLRLFPDTTAKELKRIVKDSGR